MIVEIISKYLAENKRLVVPNFGAFIVKQAGESILFSNLMKTDDGVLRGLIMAEGVSELEAAGAIGRFVFEVNYRLENDGVCLLGGFGELRSGANSTIGFKYDPSVVAEPLVGEIGGRKAKAQPEPEPEPIEVVTPVVEPAKPVVVAENKQPRVDEEVELHVVPRQSEAESSRTRKVTMDYEPRTVSSKMQPADYVKGLRYGKGRKVVTGREYTGAHKFVTGDLIIKIALAAAVIATLALGYGLWNDWRASSYDESYIDNSEIYDQVPESAEGEVRNPDLDYIQPYKK